MLTRRQVRQPQPRGVLPNLSVTTWIETRAAKCKSISSMQPVVNAIKLNLSTEYRYVMRWRLLENKEIFYWYLKDVSFLCFGRHSEARFSINARLNWPNDFYESSQCWFDGQSFFFQISRPPSQTEWWCAIRKLLFQSASNSGECAEQYRTVQYSTERMWILRYVDIS